MDKRRKILIAVGSVALVAALYFAVEHFLYVTTDNAQIDGHFVLLAAKVGGYVTDVKITEGQMVKKGDVLAELDSRDYENTLKQVEGDLTSVQAKRKDAERSYNRLRDLYAKGVVSQAQFDTSSANFSTLKAQAEAIAAQVAQAQLNLENTKIRAPANGFVAKKSVEIGQLAAPGVPLIGFVDAHERWVTANFKETEIGRIRMGAKVRVEVDALGGPKFEGHVQAISAATGAVFSLLPPDNATGNYTKVVQRVPVKIVLDHLSNEDVEKLRVGLSANVRVSIR